MFKTLLFSALILGTLQAAPIPPIEQVREIAVHNRILTKVNGKNISVLDVMKHMDVFLNRYYPQYANSKTAKYQFYSTQWRQTLQQMVDHELMVADAESREIKISDGEVREEIQTRYGPNVMGTLDELGISYEEAREMVEQDMIVQRIQWVRVTSKVLQKVTSAEIKKAYQKFLQENPAKEEWKYQFLTIRSGIESGEQAGRDIAQKLLAFQEKSQGNLAVAADLFKAESPESMATLTVSQEFDAEDKALSQAHREILSRLDKGQWSQPAIQQSRDGTKVIRIFHLKDHTKTTPPAFATVANDLKQHLLNEQAEIENKAYLAKLHQRFNFDEKSLDIPPHFEPFTAR
ncbi:MAG: SurA N-terminal domain-containing protein [Verrucomicrobia bacterium]|nr:SurA N-terminal domain-containing protein [Verrucomicrobiota bacterium]